MTDLAARAHGLAGRLVPETVLVELDRVRDARSLATALTRAGIAGEATADAVDRAVRQRQADELAVLARWTHGRPEQLAAVELDEDRRSLRGIVRGLAADVAPERRLEGAVATARLPATLLAELAAATTVAEIAARLRHHGHPLAAALATEPGAIDLLALELALAAGFVARARESRDAAVRTYVAQVVDIENVAALLALLARGRTLDADRMVLAGGDRLDRGELVAALAKAPEACRELVARAFAGTPVAAAVFGPGPATLEDAALDWQLATQTRLRRVAPEGLSAVLYVVLRRRREARQLRRAAWRVAFGGVT